MKNTKAVHETGFTLLEIMVVVAIVGLLAAISIPNYIKSRATSQAHTCINSLRQIDSAAQEFALEEHKRNGQNINFPDDLTPFIKLNAQGSIPPCPAGGTYDCSVVGTPPCCNLNASASPPHLLP
jgi:prepilin-type N-terminal cleavage/methylation domain-containing protein